MTYTPTISRVWNDNDWPYKETFKEVSYNIPPHTFIEMEHMLAVEFLGRFTPIVRDADGAPKPEFFKKLRIERTEKPVSAMISQVKKVFKCMACNKEFNTQKDYDDHVDAQHSASRVSEKTHAELEMRTKNAKTIS